MKCQICQQEISPYDLPVKIGKTFHRECFNHKRIERSNKIPYNIFLTFIVLGIPFLFFFKPLLYILGLMALGLSTFLLKDLPGVEFATLATVLAGMNFGPWVGALVGFVSTIPFYWECSLLTLFSSIGFVTIGILASYDFSFIILGLLCPLVYHLIIDGASAVIYGVKGVWASVPFTIFHLLFNLFIFYLYNLYIL